MTKNRINYYYCEGDTEKNLLNQLKSSKLILPGKVSVFNLWEKDVKNIIRLIQRRKLNRIFVIFDTDSCNNPSLFKSNLLALSRLRSPSSLTLMPQHGNLEEELVMACGLKNCQELFSSFYGVADRNKFKKKFKTDRALVDRLTKNNFSIQDYCSRTHIFDETLLGVDLSIARGPTSCLNSPQKR